MNIRKFEGRENKEIGAGLLYKKDLDKSIVKVMQVSDRVLATMILSDPVYTSIIEVYMPTCDENKDKIDLIHEQLEQVCEENGKGQER